MKKNKEVDIRRWMYLMLIIFALGLGTTVIINGILRYDIGDVVIGITSVFVTIILGIVTIQQSDKFAADTQLELDLAIKEKTPYLIFRNAFQREKINQDIEIEDKTNVISKMFPEDEAINKLYVTIDTTGFVDVEFVLANPSSTMLRKIEFYSISEKENVLICKKNQYSPPVKKVYDQFRRAGDDKTAGLIIEKGLDKLFEAINEYDLEPGKNRLCHYASHMESLKGDDVISLDICFKMSTIFNDVYYQHSKLKLLRRYLIKYPQPKQVYDIVECESRILEEKIDEDLRIIRAIESSNEGKEN